MSLQFVYGPASCDSAPFLLKQAQNWLQQAEEHQVFYLVPNHIKFETEVAVLKQLSEMEKQATTASIRLQVFSMSRLAWYFLQHTDYYQATSLTEAGTHMVIRKILIDQKDRLTVFQGEVNQTGFIEQLAQILDELIKGKIGTDDLEKMIEQMATHTLSDTQQKLKDIQLVYTEYLEFLNQEQLFQPLILSLLTEHVKTLDLSHVQFIMTGFSRLTAQEKELVLALIECGAQVTFHLVLPRAYVEAPPTKNDLFYHSGTLYFELYQAARALKVPILHDQLLGKEQVVSRFEEVDEYWQATQNLKQTFSLKRDSQPLKLYEMETAQDELSFVAKEINHLVHQKGYRYRDIEILTRDLSSYRPMLTPYFDDHEIPFSFNDTLSMEHHPLIELFHALFGMGKRYYRYEDIMRFLRTELFIATIDEETAISDYEEAIRDYRQKVDLTENVMLAYGYEGFYWTREENWQYVTYFDEEQTEMTEDQRVEQWSNEIRQDVRRHVMPYIEAMKKAQTGKEIARLWFELLVSCGVERQLVYWRDEEIALGNQDAAKNHEQTWQAFVDVLDEFVLVFGERPVTFELFEEILLSGLEGFEYSKVPTTLDQVMISSLDLVHATKNKITFIIGANEQNLPRKVENTTLLTDDDRQQMASFLDEDQYLMHDTYKAINEEPFIAYLSFLSATDWLYMTSPRFLNSDRELGTSPYMRRLATGLKTPIISYQADLSPEKVSLENISTSRVLISDLIRLERRAVDEKRTLHPLWQKLKAYLLETNEVTSGTAELVFSSLSAQNIPETLVPEIVDDLYGDTLYASVSKIERYYECEYKYFLTHGLKLREREKFELTPAMTGEFFHDALDGLFTYLIQHKLSLLELTESQLNELVDAMMEEMVDRSKYLVFTTTHRMAYIRYQLAQTIRRTSWALKQQQTRSGLTPIQTEVLFGELVMSRGLDSIVIDLDERKQLKINGKIDRLDAIKHGQQTFIGVIDYKSSYRDLNFQDIYYGLALQLMTYLDVALLNAVQLVGVKDVKPAGAFYMHVKNPTLAHDTSEDKALDLMLEQYKYQGIILNDEDVLAELDREVAPQTSSPVFNYRQLKNENYRSNQFVSEDEISVMREFTRKKFEHAGNQIYSGSVRLNPAYEGKERVACRFCPFKSVCQFDPLLKENHYHRLASLSKEEALERMAQQVKKGEPS